MRVNRKRFGFHANGAAQFLYAVPLRMEVLRRWARVFVPDCQYTPAIALAIAADGKRSNRWNTRKQSAAIHTEREL
jgi:hypothetical protein